MRCGWSALFALAAVPACSANAFGHKQGSVLALTEAPGARGSCAGGVGPPRCGLRAPWSGTSREIQPPGAPLCTRLAEQFPKFDRYAFPAEACCLGAPRAGARGGSGSDNDRRKPLCFVEPFLQACDGVGFGFIAKLTIWQAAGCLQNGYQPVVSWRAGTPEFIPASNGTNFFEWWFAQPLSLEDALTGGGGGGGGGSGGAPRPRKALCVSGFGEQNTRSKSESEAVRLLFTLQPPLQARVDAIVARWRGRPVLGVHVRGTDHDEYGGAMRHKLYTIDNWVARAATELAALGTGAILFLASDSEEAVVRFRARFGDGVLFTADELGGRVIRSALYAGEGVHRIPVLAVKGTAEDPAAYARAQGDGVLLDIEALSRCTAILWAPRTNVIELAVMLATARGAPPRLVEVGAAKGAAINMPPTDTNGILEWKEHIPSAQKALMLRPARYKGIESAMNHKALAKIGRQCFDGHGSAHFMRELSAREKTLSPFIRENVAGCRKSTPSAARALQRCRAEQLFGWAAAEHDSLQCFLRHRSASVCHHRAVDGELEKGIGWGAERKAPGSPLNFWVSQLPF